MKFLLPSFKDWLHTLWLFVLVAIWVSLMKWLWNEDRVAFFLRDKYLFLWWCIFNGMILPILLGTYIHYIFWGKHNPMLPSWFASGRSWVEGIWQWGVIISTLWVVHTIFRVLNYGFNPLQPIGHTSFEVSVFLSLVVNSIPKPQVPIATIIWFLLMGEAHLARRRLLDWINK